MSRWVFFLHGFLVLLAALGGGLASTVPVSSLVSIATALVALASVVVTVFGIWIAVIFPKMLQDLESGRDPKEVPERRRYMSLVAALYKSCFVLCSGFFVFLLLSFYGDQNRLLVGFVAFFSWLAFFSVVQSLWVAVINGEFAVGDGINQKIRKGLLKRVRAGGRVAKKKGK